MASQDIENMRGGYDNCTDCMKYSPNPQTSSCSSCGCDDVENKFTFSACSQPVIHYEPKRRTTRSSASRPVVGGDLCLDGSGSGVTSYRGGRGRGRRRGGRGGRGKCKGGGKGRAKGIVNSTVERGEEEDEDGVDAQRTVVTDQMDTAVGENRNNS